MRPPIRKELACTLRRVPNERSIVCPTQRIFPPGLKNTQTAIRTPRSPIARAAKVCSFFSGPSSSDSLQQAMLILELNAGLKQGRSGASIFRGFEFPVDLDKLFSNLRRYVIPLCGVIKEVK